MTLGFWRFSCVVLFGAAVAPLPANVIRVPADQPTIQAAVNAAANGDTVQVAAGTYVENLNFSGKAVTVTSEQGPPVTVIDGNQAGPVVTFASGEGPQSVLNGFTLQHGRSDSAGGGVRIYNSSPVITGNVINDNDASDAGGGVGSIFGSPRIEGNTITNNRQTPGFIGGTGGGGVYIGGASAAQVLRNTISGNSWSTASGGGISLFAAGAPLIRDNLISNNSSYAQGGGIYIVNQSDALIVQNLILANSSPAGGGIYWLVGQGNRGPFVVNNTVAGNNSPQGSGIFADGFDGQAQLINNIVIAAAGQTAVFCGEIYDPTPPIFKSNDVFSPSGPAYGGSCTNQTGLNGNISADPQFVNAAAGNYHLQLGSPAIDAGASDQAPSLDLDGASRPLDGNGNGTAEFDLGVFEAPTLVDQTPPTTTATPSPSPNAGGWNQANVTVTLNASDNPGGTGVKQIQYSLAGAQTSGTQVVPGSSASVTITAEGTTTLTYSALDNSGNAETAKTLTVRIDTTAPITTAAPSPGPNAAGWNKTDVTVALNAADNPGGSGVQLVRFWLTGAQTGGPQTVSGTTASVTVTAQGTTNVGYSAVDNAGVIELSRNLPVKIDKAAPVISGMPAPGCTLSPVKHQLVQVATVTASDSLSGVASFSVTATSSEPDSGTGGGDKPGDIVISGGVVQLRAERSPSGNGRVYTITATATDVAGNTATATSTCRVPK